MFHFGETIISGISDAIHGRQGYSKIEGTVVLVKRNVFDFNDFTASVVDRVSEVLGRGVGFKLISATLGDKNKDNRGVVGPESRLENWITTLSPLTPGDSVYNMTFYWDPKQGIPGALHVENHHPFEFYLKTVTLRNVPNKGSVHFDCYSWVYNSSSYNYSRVFFANDTYVTSKIPLPLQGYVDDELRNLRGDNVDREFKDGDRFYAYDLYNDLGYDRPILGDSGVLPYPRRGKTARAKYDKDQSYEKRMILSNIRLDIYVPRDERFGHLKMSDFLTYAVKGLNQSFVPGIKTIVDTTPMEFDSFQDILNLYQGGLKLPGVSGVSLLKDLIPFEMVKEFVRSDGEALLKFPTPLIIQKDKEAWKTDEEFGREMLAGVNPILIRRLQQFPPASSLDSSKYGNQNSTITTAHIEHQLEGISVNNAIAGNRLYILDHHDSLMPYLSKINADTGNKIYASRTLLFLKDDSTLKPVAIELSLPSSNGGSLSKVYTPASAGVEHHIWQLAKAYATVNDSGVHQLISHWLNTHAVIEPFIIATHRQLSVVHPIHKLLVPHFRDTMNINAQARQTLISSGGIVETTVFPGKYALEMSAVIYKSWNFVSQALPNDLLLRGVAVHDNAAPHKLRLLIKDYPYAIDGLDIWFSINNWVSEYCGIYYPTDASVQEDVQLQKWWKEVVEVGHGDRKDAPWWPKMTSIQELVFSCTTIIWCASALHAAVNFGQYPYAGYLPNRPTISRKFMPEPGTMEYEALQKNPEKVFLETITSQFHTIIGVSLIEILSRHASDEVYLGQRDSNEWTNDAKAIAAFERFGESLKAVEKEILARNQNPNLKNRKGVAQAPYELLYPGMSDPMAATGLTGKGIPNSISI